MTLTLTLITNNSHTVLDNILLAPPPRSEVSQPPAIRHSLSQLQGEVRLLLREGDWHGTAKYFLFLSCSLTDVVRVRSPSAKMIPLRVTVLLIPLVVNFQEISGECPQMEDIPVMKSSSTFTCMKFWNHKGDDWPINACNGECEYNNSAV